MTIPHPVLRAVVDGAVDFQGQAELGAVEVHDEAADDVLPAELEAQAAAIAKQPPGDSFGSRAPLPKGLGEVVLVWQAAVTSGHSAS